MSRDRHLIAKYSDINVIEMMEIKPLLENLKFKRGIFHFYVFYICINISFGIPGTIMNI